MTEKKGKIVRIWREDDEVFAVEKLASPRRQGAGLRPYRLWHNWEPARGGQWHYDIAGARWRVDYVMLCKRADAKRQHETQLANLSRELHKLHTALAPFAEFASHAVQPDEEFPALWTGKVQLERVVDWFGPYAFQKARDAYDGL